MKKTGICPKCGSNEIKGFFKVMAEIPLSVLVSRMHSAHLEVLACANCGYIEFYPDEKGLENIRSRGKPYSP